ncbi:MAG: hypothetical protein PHF82_09760 [Lutispora sp.]|nr:hypothetical protein [Lutispora sp.]
MTDIEKFSLNEDDEYAIHIAVSVARRLLRYPSIQPLQIVGLGNALYALERMPLATEGVNCGFGITYNSGDEEHSEMRYVNFIITDWSFEIQIGGSVYDKAVGSDSYSNPGWYIETGGYKDTRAELYNIEDSIEEYLNLGAEITVDDESYIVF